MKKGANWSGPMVRAIATIILLVVIFFILLAAIKGKFDVLFQSDII